jgi:hypothetical protein
VHCGLVLTNLRPISATDGSPSQQLPRYALREEKVRPGAAGSRHHPLLERRWDG